MAETLWAVGILVLLGFGWLMTRPRKVQAGDMDAPMNLERGRRQSEAEMAAAETDVLPEAEAGEAAALVGHFRELATDEHPIVPTVRRHHVYRDPSPQQIDRMRQRMFAPVRRFEADPLAAPIPDALVAVAAPVLFGDAVEEWFAPPVEPMSVAFPELPAEPEPWQLGGFTAEWSTGELAKLIDAAKAGAKR